MERTSKSKDGSPLSAVLESQIAESLAAIDPAPAQSDAMRSRLLARVRVESPRFVTVRDGDGNWVPLAPKIALKMLEDDGAMQSFLLKCDPGARLDSHEHAGDEISLVLSGDFRVGDLVLGAGDYHVARAGTRHAPASSRGGCVVFIRAPSGTIGR